MCECVWMKRSHGVKKNKATKSYSWLIEMQHTCFTKQEHQQQQNEEVKLKSDFIAKIKSVLLHTHFNIRMSVGFFYSISLWSSTYIFISKMLTFSKWIMICMDDGGELVNVFVYVYRRHLLKWEMLFQSARFCGQLNNADEIDFLSLSLFSSLSFFLCFNSTLRWKIQERELKRNRRKTSVIFNTKYIVFLSFVVFSSVFLHYVQREEAKWRS